MRRRLVAASGLATVLATGSTALAAPPWSEPRTIGSPAPSIGRATLAFGPRGTALLSRRVSGGDITMRAQDTDRLATGVPYGALVERASLRDQIAAPPVVFGRGRVALLRQTTLSEPDDPVQRVRLGLSLGSIGRPLGRRPPRRVATLTLVSNLITTGPAIAAGPRGALAIVWVAHREQPDLSGSFRVRLALRRPNGRWDRIRTVASGRFFSDRSTDSVAVAFAGRGDVVVAYQVPGVPGQASSVRVRTLRRGRRFDKSQALGPHRGIVELQLDSARDRVVAAWATQDGGEEADTPSVVRAAIRAPGSRRFGATRIIDPGEGIDRASGRLCLAMAPDGTALLAWANVRGRFPGVGYPVRVAIAEPGADFGPAAELAPNGGAADAVARSDGALMVVWTTPPNGPVTTPRQTLAAIRPSSGGPFGLPEVIGESSPQVGFDRGAAGAFDPRTGRPSVLWSASDAGSDTLQMSTRTG